MIGNKLIWPGGQKTGNLDFSSAIENLELDRLAPLLFQTMTGPVAVKFAKNLVTDDWDTIKMRQDTIKDLLNEPRLIATFNRLLKQVEEIEICAKGVGDNARGLEVDRFDAVVDGIKKVIIKLEKSIDEKGGDMMEELSDHNRYALLMRSVLFKYELLLHYTEAMTMLYDALADTSFQSTALQELKAWVDTQYIRDNLEDMRAKLNDIAGWWRGLGAFAIDVNLDGNMVINSLQVAQVSTKPFEKNGMMDGKLSQPHDGITPLLQFPQSGSGMWFQGYLLNEVGYEARRELLKLRNEMGSCKISGHDGLISLKEALKFYLSAADMVSRFKECGVRICVPELSESFVIDARDAILPELALTGSKLPVANDCRLGAKGYTSLITGPNGSGKTSYIILAGQLIWMAQLGCLLPCSSASLMPCDSLFTLFATGESEQGEDSRMGMEVMRLKEITERMTSRSLVLLNEPMTSTSAVEGIEICLSLVYELISRKVSSLLVTHYGDIYELFLKRYTDENVTIRFKSLVMTTGEAEGNINYLYKIAEKPPLMSSYARAVIETMGVTLENMLNRMDSLGMDMRPDCPSWEIIRSGEVL